MASGDDLTTLWLPNEAMRKRATVPVARDLDAVDGFIPAHYEYTRPDGTRHYALTSARDFQRILDGNACPDCLAKFRWTRTDCPICDWERDLGRDIIDQVPPEWLPSAATVTNGNG